MSLLVYLDYAGIALFAATGALAASRKQLDLIGFLFFAIVTGTGGGTARVVTLVRTAVTLNHSPSGTCVTTCSA